MSIGLYTAIILNLCFIGILPRIFFRHDGRFNLMWWITAAPFFLGGLLISLYFFHVLPLTSTPYTTALESLAVTLSVIASSLIAFTLGTHRRRLSLWHQSNDAPEEIVTYGAYKYIRHPFYTSFLLTLFAIVATCPSGWSLGLLCYGWAILNYTAAREERNLSRSALGEQYRAYMASSGRFVPRLFKGALQ